MMETGMDPKFVAKRWVKWKFPLLALVFAAQGCSSISVHSFYAEGASSSSVSARYTTASEPLKSGDSTLVAGHLLFSPHVIDAGSGSVLAIREFYSAGFLEMDSSGFLKVTISMPNEKLSPGEFLIGKNIQANLSTGNSNSPGISGCAGWADSGRVSILSVEKGLAVVEVDIKFNNLKPAGIQRSCRPRNYVKSLHAIKRVASELTYWEGKASPTLVEQAHP